jgi:hypothetical protein
MAGTPAQLLLPNSPRYNCHLCFAASPSGSPRQKRSRITICGLCRPTPSTRRGQILEGNLGRRAVCRQAIVEPASILLRVLLPYACPLLATPLPPHLLDPRSPQPCRAAPAHRCSAHRRNIRPTASCTLDASPSSRTLAFFSTARIGISSNT